MKKCYLIPHTPFHHQRPQHTRHRNVPYTSHTHTPPPPPTTTTHQTQEGGPDGSIAYEMDRPENEGLKPALTTLVKIKQEVQATNEVRACVVVCVCVAVCVCVCVCVSFVCVCVCVCVFG